MSAAMHLGIQFFNALNAFSCGTNIARQFGIARECTSDSQKAKQMDLHNNEIGYSIIDNYPLIVGKMNQVGNSNLQHQGMKELIDLICSKLNLGEMFVLSEPEDDTPDIHTSNVLISSIGCTCIN